MSGSLRFASTKAEDSRRVERHRRVGPHERRTELSVVDGRTPHGRGATTSSHEWDYPSVGRNRGARRWLVACSNVAANPMSAPSRRGPPMNEMPTGGSPTNPIGTVIEGKPAIAPGLELPPTS